MNVIHSDVSKGAVCNRNASIVSWSAHFREHTLWPVGCTLYIVMGSLDSNVGYNAQTSATFKHMVLDI